MPIKTILMDNERWIGYVETLNDRWGDLGNQADDCLREMREQLSILFREDGFLTQTLNLVYNEFCLELERLKREAPHRLNQFDIEQFISNSRFYKSLIEDISPISWENSKELKKKVSQAWLNQNEYLPRINNTLYIQSVIKKINENQVQEPQSVYDAFFNPIVHYSRLYGEEFDFQLKDDFIEEDVEDAVVESEIKVNNTPPKPIAIEIGKLVNEHLHVSGIIKRRNKFWFTDQNIIEEFSLFLSSRTKEKSDVPRGFRKRLWEFWKRFFKREKRAPQPIDEIPWGKLALDNIPTKKVFWKPICQRYKECYYDTKMLEEANAYLEGKVVGVEKTIERLRNDCNGVQMPEISCHVQEEYNRTVRLKTERDEVLASASSLYNSLDKRLKP